MTKKQLGELFNISRTTVRRYLKNIGIERKYELLSPNDIAAFFDHYGSPERKEGK